MQIVHGVTFDQAVAEMGISRSHFKWLLRQHRLELAPDGGVDPDSILAHLGVHRPPSGYISGEAASERLGISRRHIPVLIVAGILEGVDLPTRNGGHFVKEDSLVGLDMSKVAALGIRVNPPDGYTTSASARKVLGTTRSGLRWLVDAGVIRCLSWSRMNTFYCVEDVERAAEGAKSYTESTS